ncbi:MAG TPA: TIR domain-containing protein [Fibrobacteria bacterium]|nr:TIR domain-containing protein [Fibrobacteria bacterium]
MATKSNPSIINRFTGAEGKKRLLEALKNQILVAGNEPIAKAFCKKVELQTVEIDFTLMSQGGSDDDVYFLLSGSVIILANERHVATRNAGEHVGEMALLDTTSLRSATVKTLEPLVVAKITEIEFTKIANKYPDIWRRMAGILAKRLRERSKFHPVPRSQPAVFIGSSSEGLNVATSIHKFLQRQTCVSRLWSDGVFECSKTTIEDLLTQAGESDFAVIVLTSDDVTRSRGKRKSSPRDNVIFELGLFMGALKRERTIIVSPRNDDIKIPTDLLGVTRLTFEKNRKKSLPKVLKSVTREIKAKLTKYGPL